MRGCGKALASISVLTLFAAACTYGGGSTNPTANISPVASPSTSSNTNTSTTAPPAPSPSVETSPTAAGLQITSLPVHNGEVGVGYLAVSFQAAGGTAPYTWSVLDGTVPPGLALSGAGIFTGNDTAAGSFTFDVKVTDTGGHTATGKVSMRVFPALAVSQPCTTLCLVGMNCTTCGRFGSVSGGAGPYHYKVVGGAVPIGMGMNGFALTGPWPVPSFSAVPVDVLVIGPIYKPIPWGLAVSVTDDFGVTKTVTANWLEFWPVSFSGTSASCTANPCTAASITYLGGNPTDNVSVSVTQVCDLTDQNCQTTASAIAAALPPAWSASAKNGTVTLAFDCGTSCPNGFQADIFLVVVDHGACVAPAFSQTGTQAELIINWVP